MDITIATLIYKSQEYLNFVLNSLTEHTKDTNHNIKFLVVANDAEEEILDTLEEMDYFSTCIPSKIAFKFVDHRNEDKNAIWIDRVYNAWNRCIEECDTEAICFVNSDMSFSKNWIDNLAKYNLMRFIPTSRLVESGRMPSLPGLISKNFGLVLNEFNKEGFENFADEIRSPTVSIGVGAYMPSLFITERIRGIGGWRKNSGGVSGDRITFRLLEQMGIRHIMVNDSIVYHFQRGESSEVGDL